MATIRINMTMSEIMIEFTDTKDLERQLENIDFVKIESLLEKKIHAQPSKHEPERTNQIESQIVNDLGTVNLLKISEGGQDATKLAVFLASNKMNREDVKRITGIKLLS
jgi:hypothetical protein